MKNTEMAREAQSAELADLPELREICETLYDNIEALDAQQQALLIRRVLNDVKRASDLILQSTSEANVMGAASLVGSMVAMAAFANELGREQRGETSTGDIAVEQVMSDFGRLIETSSRVNVPEPQSQAPEEQAHFGQYL